MSKVLTAKMVEQIKPAKSRREISDGQATGLYLHVQPSGSKSWVVLLARPNGQLGKLRLGPVDLSGRKASEQTPTIGMPLTLADARALATDLKRQRDAGKDFITEHKAVKQQQQREVEKYTSNSFAAVAKQFIDEHARPETRRWRETARYFGLVYSNEDQPGKIKGGLADRWRDKEITAITGDDVYGVIDEARRSGIPGLVRRNHRLSNSRGRAMARVLSKFFGWCLGERKIKVSPSVGIKAPKAPEARDRVLTDDEILRFWRATDKVGEPFGAVFRMLLLTGARLREVSDMRRPELSKDGATWIIPKERVKNRRDHVVPLSPLARDILSEVKQVAGKNGHIFSTTGETPVSGFSKTKQRLDKLMVNAAKKDGVEIPPWRLHDLRRTAATTMANIGVAPHVIEAVLNHISGTKASIAGTYNRAAYEPEKADRARATGGAYRGTGQRETGQRHAASQNEAVMSKQLQRPLPDRACSTEAKRQAMIKWLNEMLDRFQPDEQPRLLEEAIELAEKEGNVEPLREVLLRKTGYDLGRFLKKPKRAHGQHFPEIKKEDPVTDAAIDAKLIWWIWKWNYPKRPTEVNAIEIAAARHNVDIDQVKNKLKKLSLKEPSRDYGVSGFLKFPRRQNSILFWWDDLEP